MLMVPAVVLRVTGAATAVTQRVTAVVAAVLAVILVMVDEGLTVLLAEVKP